ncbi:hypothetical protein HOY82DRAFT_557116 [Tuber indicum]|nr:hypothetical protein HOY82DRAFT_557116 [Tuber indicum]
MFSRPPSALRFQFTTRQGFIANQMSTSNLANNDPHVKIGQPRVAETVTAGTPSLSTAPTSGLACNLGTIPSRLGSINLSGEMFQELEAKWHQRYEMKAYEVLEQKLEISRLTTLALGWETEKIKLAENFNLRGALERIAYHGRLIQKIKSHYTLGVQAALDELAKTADFENLLAKEIVTRHLVKKDVRHCIAVVYHEASKHAHGNSSMITIYEEDHTVNERAALATFLGVQAGWPDGLKWREVKRTQQIGR